MKPLIKGLADCLRQELMVHSIDVHIYFVSTINTPGFARENETKPLITKLIEGTETSDTSPKSRAECLLKGLKAKQYAITSDFITDLMRVSALGIMPHQNFLSDLILLVISWMLLPLLRIYFDRIVCKNARNPPIQAEEKKRKGNKKVD